MNKLEFHMKKQLFVLKWMFLIVIVCGLIIYSVWVLDWFYKESGDDLKNNGLRHVGKCLSWFWKILSVTQSHHGNDPAMQWAYRILGTSRRLRKLDTDEDLNR